MSPLIAVVDDEKAVRKALERLLRSAGLRVKGFASGTAFLHSLHECKPACVVLDLHMPELDGFEILETLEREGMQLPVVVITAAAGPQNRARAFSLGACTYLSKPVDDAMLLNAVRAVVRD